MWYKKLALVLAAIGAINWGIVAINAKWNLVELLLNSFPIAVTIVYAIIGLCGIYALVRVFSRY